MPKALQEVCTWRRGKKLRFADRPEMRFVRVDVSDQWLKPPVEGKALKAVDVKRLFPRAGLDLHDSLINFAHAVRDA